MHLVVLAAALVGLSSFGYAEFYECLTDSPPCTLCFARKLFFETGKQREPICTAGLLHFSKAEQEKCDLECGSGLKKMYECGLHDDRCRECSPKGSPFNVCQTEVTYNSFDDCRRNGICVDSRARFYCNREDGNCKRCKGSRCPDEAGMAFFPTMGECMQAGCTNLPPNPVAVTSSEPPPEQPVIVEPTVPTPESQKTGATPEAQPATITEDKPLISTHPSQQPSERTSLPPAESTTLPPRTSTEELSTSASPNTSQPSTSAPTIEGAKSTPKKPFEPGTLPPTIGESTEKASNGARAVRSITEKPKGKPKQRPTTTTRERPTVKATTATLSTVLIPVTTERKTVKPTTDRPGATKRTAKPTTKQPTTTTSEKPTVKPGTK